MFARLRGWRPLLIGALALVVLLSTVSTPSAQAVETADWFGWGVKVDFENSTWKVRYVTYLGSNDPDPHVISEHVSDISAQCLKRGTGKLSYPTPDSAYFDGKVYIQCRLPSVRGELNRLGFTPPSGDQPFCPCTLGDAPFWVDGQVRQLNTSGSMPFLDASDRGVRVSLQVNGVLAQTKVEITNAQVAGGVATFTTPPWSISTAGDRTMMGWDGDAIVAVADHFGWLNYLTDPNWRSFYQTSVTADKIGYWNESPTQSGVATLGPDYRLGMNDGMLYIGYSPSTGTYFKGEIDEGGIEPGCSGA